MDTVIAAPASCEVRAVIRFLHAEGQSAAALCPSAWRKRITARTSQLAGAAMIVSMFYQYLLLHYAAKMYEDTRTARTEVPCYYWARALTLWQRVYFYQPIGGWFWNNPRSYQRRFLVRRLACQRAGGLCFNFRWREVSLSPFLKHMHLSSIAECLT